MSDARFQDGADTALGLQAGDAEDLQVISALVQDAVFPVTEMRWQRKQRRFVLMLNRCRWEDREAAAREGRPFERVQSVLTVADVGKVTSFGVDRGEKHVVLSVLSLGFEPGTEGAGRIVLVLAGDGVVALEVECVNVALRDVTRPYRAVSGKVPGHPV